MYICIYQYFLHSSQGSSAFNRLPHISPIYFAIPWILESLHVRTCTYCVIIHLLVSWDILLDLYIIMGDSDLTSDLSQLSCLSSSVGRISTRTCLACNCRWFKSQLLKLLALSPKWSQHQPYFRHKVTLVTGHNLEPLNKGPFSSLRGICAVLCPLVLLECQHTIACVLSKPKCVLSLCKAKARQIKDTSSLYVYIRSLIHVCVYLFVQGFIHDITHLQPFVCIIMVHTCICIHMSHTMYILIWYTCIYVPLYHIRHVISVRLPIFAYFSMCIATHNIIYGTNIQCMTCRRKGLKEQP